MSGRQKYIERELTHDGNLMSEATVVDTQHCGGLKAVRASACGVTPIIVIYFGHTHVNKSNFLRNFGKAEVFSRSTSAALDRDDDLGLGGESSPHVHIEREVEIPTGSHYFSELNR